MGKTKVEHKRIALLGSTGSIGTQAVEVIQSLGMEVTALACAANESLLERQCRILKPKKAYIGPDNYTSLKSRLADTDIEVVTGTDELCAIAADECDIVLNSLVGIAGLRPTLAALKAGNDVALANKETLVTGGAIVISEAKANGAKLLPVDSEHSAIFQCLQGQPEPEGIILTASGGAFYDLPPERLADVTAADALKHPTWNMGRKITVDCATLMNKGFELIEAAHLFSLPAERIEIVIHRQSIVHSMVRFVDGSVIAQLGAHDMRLPIQYALTYPQRVNCIADKLDLTSSTLTFEAPDMSRFPLLAFAIDAFKQGGNRCAALNGADEQAVALFLEGKVGYQKMQQLIIDAASECAFISDPTTEDIEETDRAARELVLKAL